MAVQLVFRIYVWNDRTLSIPIDLSRLKRERERERERENIVEIVPLPDFRNKYSYIHTVIASKNKGIPTSYVGKI